MTEDCIYGERSCEVCNATCQLEPGPVTYCGDEFVDPPDEVCDEGSNNGAGSCSDACNCAAGYHLELEVCTSDTRSCVVPNGTGSQSYAAGSWGICGVLTCDSSYHDEWGVCVGDTRACVVPNGTGSESWSGSWGICGVVTCDSSYHLESRACLSDTRSCTAANATSATESWAGTGYGVCTISACSAGYALVANGCLGGCGNGVIGSDESCDDGNTATEQCAYAELSCTVCNATCQAVAGATAYCGDGTLDAAEVCDEGSSNGAGSCSVACGCATGYHLEGGVCLGDTRACVVPNGTGSESWTGSGYGACVATACASSYHVEGGACVSDTRSCTSLPTNATTATQTWNSATSAYGSCRATVCASGFNLVGGLCLGSPGAGSLGAACTLNDECASGSCATGPTGTANDRCAPAGMNFIPAGTFMMGSPSEEVGRYTDETQHSVTLSGAFFIEQTEVTQGQWKALSGGANPSYFQSTSGTAQSAANANDSGPVEYLDWYAAVAFANARSASEGLTSCYTLTGCTNAANGWQDGVHSGCTDATFSGLTCTGYRLPTESEWEYAARGGTTTATYLGNLNSSAGCFTAQANLDGIAWWCLNSGGRTQAVGGKTANNFGLSDMLGNVREWTGDRYGTYPATVTDPLGATSGSARVFHGGSWYDGARSARAAFRYNLNADFRYSNLGFRLARTAP